MAKRLDIKLLLMSLISGLCFPVFYLLALMMSGGHGAETPVARIALLLPVYWPWLIYYLLPDFPFDGTVFIIATIICNITLYSFLAYALLRWSSNRKIKLP